MRAVVVLVILGLAHLSFAGWLEVNVSNQTATVLGGYPMQLSLDSNFPFASSTSDGSDVQIYDGTRTEQFASYVQQWDKAGGSGTIWFRMPYLAAYSSSNLWLHYANSGSFQQRVFPWGPYVRSTDQPVVFMNRGTHTNFLVENVVYDPDTGHWWMVMGDNSSVSVDLAYSDDPNNVTSWTWWGEIVTGENGNGPCLLKDGSTWYLFEDHNREIAYRTATSITGLYSAPISVLQTGVPGSWESYRVTEPYVFKRGKNDYVLIYMGDSHAAGNPAEQVGYATATKITGPYTKYPANPFIHFGPPGAYDAGTAADPWVLQVGSVFYIGYSISPTYKSPWKTGFASTTDWTNVVKYGQLFVTGSDWDVGNAFRGAGISVSNTFLLPYTSADYKPGLATARAATNDPNQVFLWQDDFSGTALNPNYWHGYISSGSIKVNDGILTMSCGSKFLELTGPSVGQDYIAEFRARHRTHGTLNRIMEVGLGPLESACVRLDDDYTDTANWEGRTRISGETVTNLLVAADAGWHTFAVARTNGVAMWRVDDSAWTVVSDTNVDSSTFLQVFMIAYGAGDVVDSDWVRLRRFVSPEPSATLSLSSGVPTITQQPSNQTVSAGSTVNLLVSATGSTPLTYQWWFNGAPISGGSDSSYILARASSSSAGPYAAVVSNGYGAVTSAVAWLTVLVPPSITTEPTNQTVVPGASASFFASAKGSSPMSYQWFFDNKAIPGATANTFSITNARVIDAGSYALIITNLAGSAASSNAYLKVLVAPTLAAPEAIGSGISIPVPSVAGLNYLLEYKNTLEDPDWTAVTSWAAGTGGILVLQDTNTPSAPRFYRVRCQ